MATTRYSTVCCLSLIFYGSCVCCHATSAPERRQLSAKDQTDRPKYRKCRSDAWTAPGPDPNRTQCGALLRVRCGFSVCASLRVSRHAALRGQSNHTRSHNGRLSRATPLKCTRLIQQKALSSFFPSFFLTHRSLSSPHTFFALSHQQRNGT